MLFLSYWLGSQATGQPIYQYRIIYADDDKFMNISTDADINVEGEIKWPLAPQTLGKLNFTVYFFLLFILFNRILYNLINSLLIKLKLVMLKFIILVIHGQVMSHLVVLQD